MCIEDLKSLKASLKSNYELSVFVVSTFLKKPIIKDERHMDRQILLARNFINKYFASQINKSLISNSLFMDP